MWSRGRSTLGRGTLPRMKSFVAFATIQCGSSSAVGDVVHACHGAPSTDKSDHNLPTHVGKHRVFMVGFRLAPFCIGRICECHVLPAVHERPCCVGADGRARPVAC